MTDFVFKPNSSRAQRARYAEILRAKWLVITASLCGGLSFALGVLLLVVGSSFGWMVMIPAAWAGTGYIWYRGQLRNIPVGAFETPALIFVHEALETDTLARLSKVKTPFESLSAFDLWQVLKGSEAQFFIGNRFLLDSSFYEQFISRDPGSALSVWNIAQELHLKHQTKQYSNILLFVALAKSVPNVDQLLQTVGLDMADVETAIPWMSDILEKRTKATSKRNFGGIGRDWAYGYTPILRSLGHNITEGIEMYGFFSDTRMHEPIVQQMIQVISSRQGVVTLVGDDGVGKTTSVYALAEALLTDATLPKNTRYSQVIELDASTLIANAKRPGELEDLMLHILAEAQRAKNIILFLDEAQVFFGASTGSVDLSHVLQPLFESGNVRLILAMNPQHWQRLSSAGVAARLKPITVPSADEDNTIAVLRDKVGVLEYRHKLSYTYQALHEAYKLGGRYVTTQSMPGAALSVLEQTATSTSQQLVTREVIQQAVEQAYGIKLQTASADESSNLLRLEDDLKAQVISQNRAISVIANALRRARSGVGNPDRPIGTFLFLGPTGVGKTELSKALARSYFNDESALIRVDMNQYVSANDVNRLIAPMQGSELGFLGEVRKKPFSVILFDEIEKAHSSVVNALLQMLDEGIMRDSDNKPVSFRDAIIIATSNAGADEIRKFIEEGKDVAELENTFVDTLISRGSFAPEFVNRFDEVVLFKPLSPEDLTQVIDLIVGGINKTLDAQKVSVSLTNEAKLWLVNKGYDSRLGARPMRRMAQRYVENIVAKRLLEGSLQTGGSILLDVPDFEAADN